MNNNFWVSRVIKQIFMFSLFSKIEVVQNVKYITLFPFCKAVGGSERTEVLTYIKRLKSEVISNH